MNFEEMEERRKVALRKLEEAVQEIGPIADETPGIVREPLLQAIEQIDGAGEEIKQIRFEE